MIAPAAIATSRDEGLARVHAWRAQHLDVWAALETTASAGGRRALELCAASHLGTPHSAPIRVDGQVFAVLAGDATITETWLCATAGLIAASIANEGELETMTNELVETYDQLSFLYDTMRSLDTKTTLPEALRLILVQARFIVGAEGSALVVARTDGARIVLTEGDVPGEATLLAAHDKAVRAERALVANTAEAVRAYLNDATADTMTSMVVVPAIGADGTASAACFGALKPQGFTAGNRKLVQALAERSNAIVARFAYEEEQIRRSRIARDLELAAHIQTALLPAAFPGTADVSLSATMLPANEVGGDFYLHPEQAVGAGVPFAIGIGDVAGKGVAAALITTMCLSALRAEGRHSGSPAATLRAVQHFIAGELDRIESFVSCIYAVYDPAARLLTYANAGHLPIVHWRAATGALIAHPATGLPFGVDVGIEIADAVIALAKDDIVVFYTDGVTEAMTPDGALFGAERLAAAIASVTNPSCVAVEQAILAAVHQWAPNQRDDITLLVMKAEA